MPQKAKTESLLTVRLPSSLHDELLALARAEGRTASQIVRFMVRWYITDRKKDSKGNPVV